jgi:hypothetical protein
VDKLGRDLGLFQLLENVLGDRAHAIIAIAGYLISGNRKNMEHLEFWQNKAYVPDVSYTLDRDARENLFRSISDDEVKLFFEKWIEINKSPESGFCFDIPLVEHEAADKYDDHLQMFCHDKTKMPLFFCVYDGMKNKSGKIAHINRESKAMGIKRRIPLLDVYDKWLSPQKNGFSYRIPGSMESALDFVHDLLNTGGYKLIPSGEWQHATMDAEYLGSKGKVAIVVPRKSGSADCFATVATVTEGILKNFKQGSSGKSKTATKAVIEKAIEIADNQGFVAYFTTEEWTTLQMLEKYNAKDVISSMFPNVTNKDWECCCFPLGQLLASFVASAILWQMTVKLRGVNVSMYEVCFDLKTISLLTADGFNFGLRSGLNVGQQKLLKIFGVDEQELNNKIKPSRRKHVL